MTLGTIMALIKSLGGSSGGGSGGAFIVNATVNFETGVATLDKTLAEIVAAAEAGSYCVVKIDADVSVQLVPLTEYGDSYATFGSAIVDCIYTLKYNSRTQAWEYYEVEVPLGN